MPATTPPVEGGRWRGRPRSGTAVRVVALTVPLIASVASAWGLSRLVGRPSGAGPLFVWWLMIAVTSTVVLLLVERVARRLLPLATLLKLTMAFPDQAPSRFAVAARAGSTRNLQERLSWAEEHGIHDEPSEAAARILALVGSLDAHDRRTRGHSERVRAFNDLIADQLHLPEPDRDRLRWAALLHDIGKLRIPTRVLNKPAAPTKREWQQLQAHPATGARIAAPLANWLGPWADAIGQHHERWDGSGYPDGISGEQISLGARIVAVADSYEVMTAPRPYSRPVSPTAARKELANCAGTQFDPDVVRAFLNVSIGHLRKAMGPLSWLAQIPFLSTAPRFGSGVMASGHLATVTAATGGGVLAAGLLGQAASPVVEAQPHVDVVASSSAHPTDSPPPSTDPSVVPSHPAPSHSPSPVASRKPSPKRSPASSSPQSRPATHNAHPSQAHSSTLTGPPVRTQPTRPATRPTPTPVSPTRRPRPSQSPAPAPSATTVTGHVSGPLTVRRGQRVYLHDAEVSGPVTVQRGGALFMQSSEVRGPLNSQGASWLGVCHSEIDGPVSIEDSTGPVLLGDQDRNRDGHDCPGNFIRGPVNVHDNAGGVEIVGNTIVGPLEVAHNAGKVIVDDNRVNRPDHH